MTTMDVRSLFGFISGMKSQMSGMTKAVVIK